VLTETLVNAYEDNYFRPIKKEELREVLQRNLDFYQQQGRRRAALHTEWKLADLLEGEKRLEFLRKVSNFYEELPENGETIARICALLRDKQLDEAWAGENCGLLLRGLPCVLAISRFRARMVG